MKEEKVEETPKPMEYLHPFQVKESRENWEMEMALRPVILDIACIAVTVYQIIALSTGFGPKSLTSTLIIGITAVLALLVLGLASAYRYALHPKLPKWARLTVMIPCYLMCVCAFIRLAMSL